MASHSQGTQNLMSSALGRSQPESARSVGAVSLGDLVWVRWDLEWWPALVRAVHPPLGPDDAASPELSPANMGGAACLVHFFGLGQQAWVSLCLLRRWEDQYQAWQAQNAKALSSPATDMSSCLDALVALSLAPCRNATAVAQAVEYLRGSGKLPRPLKPELPWPCTVNQSDPFRHSELDQDSNPNDQANQTNQNHEHQTDMQDEEQVEEEDEDEEEEDEEGEEDDEEYDEEDDEDDDVQEAFGHYGFDRQRLQGQKDEEDGDEREPIDEEGDKQANQDGEARDLSLNEHPQETSAGSSSFVYHTRTKAPSSPALGKHVTPLDASAASSSGTSKDVSATDQTSTTMDQQNLEAGKNYEPRKAEKSSPGKPRRPRTAEKTWSCQACTFVHRPSGYVGSVSACVMCGTSRYRASRQSSESCAGGQRRRRRDGANEAAAAWLANKGTGLDEPRRKRSRRSTQEAGEAGEAPSAHSKATSQQRTPGQKSRQHVSQQEQEEARAGSKAPLSEGEGNRREVKMTGKAG
eukprot:g72470.t1